MIDSNGLKSPTDDQWEGGGDKKAQWPRWGGLHLEKFSSTELF